MVGPRAWLMKVIGGEAAPRATRRPWRPTRLFACLRARVAARAWPAVPRLAESQGGGSGLCRGRARPRAGMLEGLRLLRQCAYAASCRRWSTLRAPNRQCGWAVLLSDIDIAVLRNPFKFLYRWGGAQHFSLATQQSEPRPHPRAAGGRPAAGGTAGSICAAGGRRAPAPSGRRAAAAARPRPLDAPAQARPGPRPRHSNPNPALTHRTHLNMWHRDHDVEGQTDGFDNAGAYGAIEGVDDPSMGWARCARARRACEVVCEAGGGVRAFGVEVRYARALVEWWSEFFCGSLHQPHKRSPARAHTHTHNPGLPRRWRTST